MKGFALTVDAMLAVTLALIMFATILTTLSQVSVNNFDRKHLYNIGNDMLLLMDKYKTFVSYVGKSTSFVNRDLGNYVELLPENLCGNLTVVIYDGSVGPPVSFTLDNTYYNITQDCQKVDKFTLSKRSFSEFENQKFGIATFEVWLK